jgi:C4-type Zn-finger protein
MNNNVLNKITEVEGIIKEIKDNLKIKKDTEKDKHIHLLLLQKEKYDQTK